MSRYTITIRNLQLNNFDFGMKDYLIFDESYRIVLNEKILNHYKFREIGFETAEIFKHYLNTTLKEIMPKYNAIYKYQKSMLDKDIFVNFDQTETLTRETSGSSESNSSSASDGKNKNVFQDTPAGSLKDEDIESYSYATNASISKAENNSSVTDESILNNTENYTKRITGNIGARYYPEVMEVFIKNLVNIDMEIINELQDLFMLVY